MAKKYRYPGTKSFSFDDRSIFFGRNEDISNLCTSVIVNSSTLLFGKSGTGKSSIIQAGMIPKLQERRSDADTTEPYIIINVMPKPYEPGKDISVEVNKILLQKLSPGNNFLHLDGAPEFFPLWYILKQFHFQLTADTKEQTLLLIFDQAEELFTYPDSQVDKFVEELRPVIGQFIPAEIQNRFNNPAATVSADQIKLLRLPLPVRFIFSIRSDKLHLVTRIKKASPLILHNSYELLPLKKENAFEAIDGPTKLEGEFASNKFEITKEAKEYIFERLSEQPDEPENNFEEVRIEPFSLQLICSHIEQKIVPKDKDKKIERKELKEPALVINSYYKDTVDNLPEVTDDEKNDARNLIEFRMISGKRRVPMHEALIDNDKYKISKEVLAKLVDARILKRDHSISGGMIYEITHDCFIDPILEAKAQRLGKSDDNLLETIIDLQKKIKSKESFTTTDEPLKKRTVNLEKTSKKKNLNNPGSTSSSAVDEFELYELYKKLGDAFNLTKDYQNAIKYFDKALKFPNKEYKSFFIDAYKSRSNTHYYQKNYDLSTKDLKELLKLDPNEPRALKYLVDNYDEQSKLTKAVKFFTSEFRITSRNAGVFIEIGNKYYAKMDFVKAKEFYLKTIKKDPKSDIAIRNVGLCEESLRNIDKALLNYKKALKLKPDSAAIYNDIGNILYARRDYVNAKKYYTTASKKDPDFLFPNYNMGLVEEALLNWNGAIKNYQKVLHLDPNYDNALFRMAAAYFEMKDYEKARQICNDILAINPDKSECYFGLGQIEEALKNSDAAIGYYQKATARNPKYEDAYIRTAGIYFDKKEYGEAKKIYTKLIQINPNEEANYHDMGMLEERLKNKKAAIINYEKAIKLNPGYEEPIARLVNIYFENKDPLRAKKYCKMLVSLDPNNVNYHTDLARIEHELKNEQAAIEVYKAARRIDPKNEAALAGLGGIYFDSKDFKTAKIYYTILVKVNQGIKEYYSDLGYIQNKLQNKNAAIDNYKKALKIDPQYENALFRLADLYVEHNEFRQARECYATLTTINPQNADVYNGLGYLEEKIKNNKAAIANFEKALKIDPKNEEALLKLAGIYFDNKDYKEAKKYYTTLIKLNPGNYTYYSDLGFAENKLQNRDAAIAHYKKALQIYPKYESALYRLADLYLEHNDFSEAKKCYAILIWLDPKKVSNYIDLGDIEIKIKNPKRAIVNYQKALKIDPKNEETLLALGGTYFDLEDFRQAKKYYAALIGVNRHNETYLNDLGFIENELHNTDKAIEYYKEALLINPKYENALLRLAEVYYNKNDFEQAKKCYATLLKIDPKNAIYHADIGLIEENLRNTDAATIHYEKAIELNPESESALAGLAGIYFDKENFRLAKTFYTKLISLNDKNPAYHTDLGSIETKLKHEKVAFEHYRRALKIAPGFPNALSGLAKAYLDIKKPRKARELFAKLISIDPRNPNYYNDMAVAEEELKDFDAAILNYKKALKLNPRAELVLSNLANIYLTTKEYQKSKETSIDLISINPARSEYFYTLAVAEEKLGNKKEALINYKKTLRLNPENKQAKKKLKLIGKK